jgi:hypothetical protein
VHGGHDALSACALGNIFAGFGELAHPLRIERVLEAPIIGGVKVAFEATEVARHGC